MFTKSAALYDTICAAQGKDYAGEAQRLNTLVQQYKRCSGNSLLDVACGTGGHIRFLQPFYEVTGLEIDPAMLEIAQRCYPDVVFHQADMIDFELDGRFDVVACLFSSIGYVKTVDRLRQAIHNMRRHTHSGGLVIIEPWLSPESYQAGRVFAAFVDQPELKIARMNVSAIEDGMSVLNFHYLVATPGGVEYFAEPHTLGLFSHEEYGSAFAASGVETVYDSAGLTGRGLYIGINTHL